MFNKIFGDVTIKTEVMPKRGLCLHISKADGTYILADFCGMNPMLVPDGTNAYLFGNKLIFVTRWSDMSEAEIDSVENDEIQVVIHPYQFVQFSIKIGENWGDVMTTLHNFCTIHNDLEKPVDEMIFIFADTHDSDYLSARSVKLPISLQNFLKKANENSLKKLTLDDDFVNICRMVEDDPVKDEFDLLYDICYEKTKETSRMAKEYEPDNVPDGIYVTINEDNEITDIHQHEYVEAEKVSEEAEMFLSLAKMGISEAQYNLGVCYEQGDGVEQDFEKAVYWYKAAAEQGYDKAQSNLGLCYYNGYGVEVDFAEAARLFTLSAEQGNMYAQFSLAVLYMRGEGVDQNPIRAIELLKKAASQGHPQAKAFLSDI